MGVSHSKYRNNQFHYCRVCGDNGSLQGGVIFKNIAQFLNCAVTLPIKILCDNMGAVFLSNNYEGKRTKYLETQYHFVREYVEKDTVAVKFVRSSENYADIFTKNVGADVHRQLTDYLCL